MTTTPETPTAELDQIHDHPANPRLDAVADDELVESIRHQGVLDPLMVAPRAEGGWDLIDGHRRKNGAVRAGLTVVPIHPRYDLVTDAQKIEVMVVTGLQKALLSPVEEAAGYEQLTLLGMDPAAIAEATGFAVRRVRERMKLNVLSEDVRSKVHAGEATLVDAAAFEEFDGDPVVIAKLEEALGTRNFQFVVQDARSHRARMDRRAAIAAEFVDQGAEFVDDEIAGYVVVSRLAEDLRDPEVHDGCLGYKIPESVWSEPYLVCTTPSKHPIPEAKPVADRRVSEWEKQQAARAERLARQTTAAAVRVAWLRDYFTAMFPVRSHGDLVKAATAGLPLLVVNEREAVGSTTLLAALGVTLGTDHRGSALEEDRALRATATTIRTAKSGQVLATFAGYLAALIADQMVVDDAELIDDLDEVQYLLGLWDWLKSAGYPLSDVDVEDRTALEIRHTELAAEAEEAAS